MSQGSKKTEEFDIPGYTILKQLGRGGMAAVYLALQESIDREVALKIMLPQLSIDETFSARFLREARISAKLAHPNIVSVFDVGVSGNTHYISMEYHPGGDLKALMKQGVSVEQTLHIIKEIASALDFAGKKGFVHRDIKPENILFSQTGSAVLADFGIARATEKDTQLTATGSIIGTPQYMCPEQIQGKHVDNRSDLYSLGVVFYQMLTGKVPYTGDSAVSIGIKHISEPIPALAQSLSKYQSFLEKTMAKDPEHRWKNGSEMVTTLDALQADETGTVSATIQTTLIDNNAATQILTPTTENKAGGVKWGIALGLVLVLVGSAFFSWQSGYFGPATEPGSVTTDQISAKESSQEKIIQQQTLAKEEELNRQREKEKSEAVRRRQEKQKKIAEEKRRQELKNKLNNHLSRANSLLEPSNISISRIENAYQHYQTAVKLSPSNRAVQQLPKRIAEGYKQLANQLRTDKNWDKATRTANMGLDVLPGYKPLRKLLKKIKKEKKGQRRRGFGGF